MRYKKSIWIFIAIVVMIDIAVKIIGYTNEILDNFIMGFLAFGIGVAVGNGSFFEK